MIFHHSWWIQLKREEFCVIYFHHSYELPSHLQPFISMVNFHHVTNIHPDEQISFNYLFSSNWEKYRFNFMFITLLTIIFIQLMIFIGIQLMNLSSSNWPFIIFLNFHHSDWCPSQWRIFYHNEEYLNHWCFCQKKIFSITWFTSQC